MNRVGNVIIIAERMGGTTLGSNKPISLGFFLNIAGVQRRADQTTRESRYLYRTTADHVHFIHGPCLSKKMKKYGGRFLRT